MKMSLHLARLMARQDEAQYIRSPEESKERCAHLQRQIEQEEKRLDDAPAPSAGSGQQRPPRTVGCTAGADCIHECPIVEPEARLDEFKTTVIAMLDPELTGEQKKAYIAARGRELRERAALLPPASKPPAERGK